MSLSVKSGVSTWLWTSPIHTGNVEEIFSNISKFGFEAVEIALEDPSVLDKEAVKAALQKYKLIPIVCGAFGPSRDLTHEDPAVHQQCFDYIEECLRCAVAWGAAFVAGPMYSAVGKTRMLPAEKRAGEWKLAVKNLRIASEMAASYNCLLALEPLNRFESDLVNTAKDVSRLVKDINHPAAKIMLDSFHMSIEESDPYEAIITAGKDLIHMQISENHRGIPGTGITPWNRYRDALKSIGYKDVVSIESFTPQNQELAGAVCIWHPFAESQDEFARQGLKFMSELFKEN
jgi:D-psicose/D-tagatose/L-ribulose 3-epimerase